MLRIGVERNRKQEIFPTWKNFREKFEEKIREKRKRTHIQKVGKIGRRKRVRYFEFREDCNDESGIQLHRDKNHSIVLKN